MPTPPQFSSPLRTPILGDQADPVDALRLNRGAPLGASRAELEDWYSRETQRQAQQSPSVLRAFEAPRAQVQLGEAQRRALEAEVAGDEEARFKALQDIRIAEARAQAFQPSGPTTAEEARKTGDWASYFANTAAGALGSTFDPLAGGIVGGLIGGRLRPITATLGAAIPSYTNIRGAEQADIAYDPTLSGLSAQEKLDLASQSALGQTAFEAALPALIGGRVMRKAPRYASVPLSAGIEAGTEVAQLGIGEFARQQYVPDRPGASSQEYLENLYAGGIGGAAIDLLLGGARRRPSIPQRDEEGEAYGLQEERRQRPSPAGPVDVGPAIRRQSLEGVETQIGQAARIDVIESGGESFLETQLVPQLRDLDATSKTRLADYLDNNALGFESMTASQQNRVLENLTPIFGSFRKAREVLDYYGQQNAEMQQTATSPLAQQLSETAAEFEAGMTGQESGPQERYTYAEPTTGRPFRAFIATETASGKRVSEAEAARQSRFGGTYGRVVGYGDVAEQQGANLEQLYNQRIADLDNRIAQNQARRGEDRTQAIQTLQGERSLIEATRESQGIKAALNQYQVIEQAETEANPLEATDREFAQMGRLLKSERRGPGNAEYNRQIRDTRVRFRMKDGSVRTLSAESMWKTQGDKEGSGQGENYTRRAQRLFSEAVSSILARPDVAGLETDLNNVLLDRSTGLRGATPVSAVDTERSNRILDRLTADENNEVKLRSNITSLVELYNNTETNDPATARAVEQALSDKYEDVATRYENLGTRDRAPSPADARERNRLSRLMDVYSNALSSINPQEDFDPTTLETQEPGTEAVSSGPRFAEEDTGMALQGAERVGRTAPAMPAEQRAALPEPKTPAGQELPRAARLTPEQRRELAGSIEEFARQISAIAETEATGLPAAGASQEAFINKFLEQNPDMTEAEREALRDWVIQRASLQEPGAKASTPEQQQAAIDEIVRTRGDDVQVAFVEFADIRAAGEYTMDPKTKERFIRIASTAADPTSVAWHEAMHDFFTTLGMDRASRDLKAQLLQVASSPFVVKQLRTLLSGHPAALQQIKDSQEERLSYMYQFWAAGQLSVTPKAEGLFQKIAKFLRDLFGVLSKDEKIEQALTAFHSGELQDPNTVTQVLRAKGVETLSDKLDRVAGPFSRGMTKVFRSPTDRLRDTGVPQLIQIADMFDRNVGREEGGLEFLQARFQQEGVWSNRLQDILENTTEKQRVEAVTNLQSMKEPKTELEKDLAELFSGLYDYMDEAGVLRLQDGQWQKVPKVERYYPRVWDKSVILANRNEWERLLGNYLPPEQVSAVTDAIISGDGRLELAETEHHLGFSPYHANVQDRTLKFINESNAEQFAKFQSKDLYDTVGGYIKQAVHRGEYARAFGNNGEVITNLLQQASESGVDQETIEESSKNIRALEGSLGNDMSVRMKEIMSSVMTLQNMVLLPLAIFSQMVDPLGIAVRTGNLADAGEGYKRALKDLRRTIQRDKSFDYDREMTRMLGIINEDSMLEAMGQTYGSMYMTRTTRNLNRVFFRLNGMQGWNNSMRVAATVAGERYIIQYQADDRRMNEIGLRPEDIKVRADGRLEMDPDVLGAESYKRMSEAMFKFVDGAIIRPSASQRATWMSDPRFMLISHLKQFAYSFQRVILARAISEARNGNDQPMLMLAAYVPVMFAADMAKWILTGSVPQNWDIYDHFGHAVARSGILGKFEFGTDIIGDVQYGNVPGLSFAGPAAEHAVDLASWIGGDPTTDFQDVVERTVPGARFVLD